MTIFIILWLYVKIVFEIQFLDHSFVAEFAMLIMILET